MTIRSKLKKKIKKDLKEGTLCELLIKDEEVNFQLCSGPLGSCKYQTNLIYHDEEGNCYRGCSYHRWRYKE
jgi:hypothetical protein